MECPRCKRAMTAEEYSSFCANSKNTDPASVFSAQSVLQHHQAIHDRLACLTKNSKLVNFFEKDPHNTRQNGRPVLTHSILPMTIEQEDLRIGLYREDITLKDMKLDQTATNCRLQLWIVTKAKATSMTDGTFYAVVRDQFDRHVRLVVSNWSYVLPTTETISLDASQRILDELLPIGSAIKLHDPLLMKCIIDHQPSLRCDAPNSELILSEHLKNCFVLEKLDTLRDRGNQAYIRGDIQLALDYYTLAIKRVVTMAEIAICKGNEQELQLFHGAFRHDLARLQSNRAACYIRERHYEAANMDAAIIVAGQMFTGTHDELFLKCLHRMICSTIGMEKCTSAITELLNLGQNVAINVNLRWKYSSDFNQIYLNLPRLKDERERGHYQLKDMFKPAAHVEQALFDTATYHSDFRNSSLIKERNDRLYAKRSIPAGTLILAQKAFAAVPAGGCDLRRLANEIERRLVLAPTVKEFDLIRTIPCINRWFHENTDADDDDYDTYPDAMPWGLLAHVLQRNPYRSTTWIGLWSEAMRFDVGASNKKRANCLWFVCEKMIFFFSFVSIDKNEELIVDHAHNIRSFLTSHRSDFVFFPNEKNQVRLDEIFDELKTTQIYLSN